MGYDRDKLNWMVQGNGKHTWHKGLSISLWKGDLGKQRDKNSENVTLMKN